MQTVHPKLYIGTSGWSYSNWKGILYPQKFSASKFLEFYANEFNCTEINSSFYRIPMQSTAEKWAAITPDDFKFSAKIYRGITHFARLKNCDVLLQAYFERMAPLQPKLAMVLIQLPPSLVFNAEVVTVFFDALKPYMPQYNFALEARHASWFTDESLWLMAEAGITHVISDAGNFYVGHKAVTSNSVYMRMHGRTQLFASNYTEQELDEFAEEITEYLQEGFSAYIYFNNTMHGYAITNAFYLRNKIAELLRHAM